MAWTPAAMYYFCNIGVKPWTQVLSNSLLKDALCSFCAVARCLSQGIWQRRKAHSRRAVGVSMVVQQLMGC